MKGEYSNDLGNKLKQLRNRPLKVKDNQIKHF